MQPGRTIYCIGGLGTDELVFRNISIPNTRLIHLSWLPHQPKESLSAYAGRMASQISEPDPIILGLSFGGMIAVEIARQSPVKSIIIISGIKTSREMPRWMRLAGKWYLHKWLPVRSNKITERYDNRVLGVSNAEEERIVRKYRQALDKKFQAWAIHSILTWKNDWYPDGTVHIHGNRDKMFPIRNINATHVINDGTHIMIYNRSNEINKLLTDHLHDGGQPTA